MVSSASLELSEDDNELEDPSAEEIVEEEEDSDTEEDEEEEEEEPEEVEETEEVQEEENEEVEEEEEVGEGEEEDESEAKEEDAEHPADVSKSTFDADHYHNEKSIPMSLPNALCVKESSGNFKFPGPSDEIMSIVKDYLHAKQQDRDSPKVRLDAPKVKDNRSEDLVVKNGEDESTLSTRQEMSSRVSKDHSYQSNISETINPSSFNTGKASTAFISQRDCMMEEINGSPNIGLEMNLGCNVNEIRSRLNVPHTRTRSLSANGETTERNKRPAVICDFFAKGWCIRGTSCRFLHIKDHTNQHRDGEVAIPEQKKEINIDKGLKDPTRSKSPGFPFPFTSSESTSTFSSHSSERILPSEAGGSSVLHEGNKKYKLSSLIKDDALVGKHNSTGEPSALMGTLPHAHEDIYNASHKHLSSPLTCTEGLASSFGQNMYKGFTSFVSARSQNLSSDSHSSRSAPSYYTLSQARPSYSLGAALDRSPHNSQMLRSDREHCASRLSMFLPCSLLGSEPRLSSINSSRDLSGSTGYKFKISANDWEPSVPFRPSFFITPMSISSPGKQYDPFWDSVAVELPNIGDGSLKIAFCNRESSIHNTSNKQVDDDPAAIGNQGVDLNGDKSSVSSHNRLYNNVHDRDYYSRDKDSLPNETEVTRTSGNCLNDAMTTGENHPHSECWTKADNHGVHQNSNARQRKDLQVHMDTKPNEVDSESKMDEAIQTESKAQKHFRAALVDIVKELLKPAWREGQITKDAHNIIVKRSAEKVLSTLQPHKFPTSPDAVKQYLSVSRPKIAKLVEAYTLKYGKS